MIDDLSRKDRRSFRLKSELRARIINSRSQRVVPILNISQEGALLKADQYFKPGEIIEVKMYSPSGLDSINLRARVIRTTSRNSFLFFRRFNVGVEFL